MKSILIVDDDSKSIKAMGDILSPYYKVRAANSANSGFEALNRFDDIELILLDVIMPIVTGYQMMEKINKNNTFKHIPVIFISGLDDVIDAQRGFELGAVDYISKPAVPSILLARVNTHIDISLERKKLKKYIDTLENTVGEKDVSYNKFKDIVFLAITYLVRIDSNNIFDSNISNGQKYMKILCRQLMRNNEFEFELTDEFVDNICLAMPLHDLGTIGINDDVLLKTDTFTSDDYTVMKQHTTLGYESLEYAVNKLGIEPKDMGYIDTAIEIAHYHHECWDGSGYPEGLEGYEIPLSARLMFIVDVFDALLTEKAYRPKYKLEEARQIIIDGRGVQFEPVIVDAFNECFDKLVKITKEF